MIFPDCSYYQKEINFDTMKSKTDYIILRAGQKDWIDPFFERNRAECERVSLSWGAYWLYDDRSSPGKQADALYSLFNTGQPRPAEIYCDWEVTYGGNYPGLKNVVAFMERVELLMGMKVGMYTGYYWFLGNSTPYTNPNQYKFLESRSLWLAWYTDDFTSNGIEHVKIPKPWTKMNIWQYGTPVLGAEYGVSSKEIDMNLRLDGITPPSDVNKPSSLYTSHNGIVTKYNHIA